MKLSQMLTMLSLAVVFFARAEARWDDDDECYYNSDSLLRVEPRDCPHDCCWGNTCGSSGECRRALIIGLIVGGVILAIIIIVVVGIVFCCCTDRCCFKSKQVVYTEPVAPAQQGYPAQQQGYPAQQYPQQPVQGQPVQGYPQQQPVGYQQPVGQYQQPPPLAGEPPAKTV